MPGPVPKDPNLRQRRNKPRSKALLPPESKPIGRRPSLPAHPNDESGWHDLSARWWEDVWASPMRSEFLRGDLPALFRLVLLVDTYWKTGDLAIAREIRLMEREFGLTPLSRRRLEWTVAQTEEAVDQREIKRAKRAQIVDGASVDLTSYGYTKAEAIREGGTGPTRIEQTWQMTTDYIFVFAE